MKRLEALAAVEKRTDLPDFKTGDMVKVHVRVVEGEKERIQIFEGVVIEGVGERSHIHRSEDLWRYRCREDISAQQPDDQQDRARSQRESAPGETELSAGPGRQARPREGTARYQHEDGGIGYHRESPCGSVRCRGRGKPGNDLSQAWTWGGEISGILNVCSKQRIIPLSGCN